MPSPVWTQDLIADLSQRVKQHNEQIGDPSRRVKLTDLKKRYANGYRGDDAAACAAAAAANVDRHLERLAKAFDASKHPRGGRGEFTAKGGKGSKGGDGAGGGKQPAPEAAVVHVLPKTRAEHEKLQDENAGYNALTSDVVPETRFAEAGAAIRNAAGLALGAGTVFSLAHSGNGRAARLIGYGARQAAKHAIGFPVMATAYMASGAGHKIAAPIARRFGRQLRSDHRVAEAVSNAAYKAGEAVGGGAGWVARHGSHNLIDLLTRVGGKKFPRLGRYGVLTGLSIGAGSALSNALKGTPLDPEVYGTAADAYGYRTVQKMVAANADALDAVAAEVLSKVQADGSLAKLNFDGLYSTVGRRLLTGAVAIAGGGAAAGATEAVHAVAGSRRGNPNHDSRGRFTSKGDAATAATIGIGLAGAAAAGIGAYAALRRHNLRAFAEAIRNAGERITEQTHAIDSKRGTGAVAKLIENRDQAIANRMAADKVHQAELARFDAYAGSHELHFKTQIRNEVNNKLASYLSQTNEFRVPAKGVAASKWQTIADIRRDAGPLKADMAAYKAVRDAVDTATKEDFEKAVQGLTDEGKKTALGWFNTRSEAMDRVDSDIAGHQAKIDAAHEAVANAQTKKEAARIGVLDAKAVLDRATTDAEKAPAHEAYLKAAQAQDDASAAVTKAEKARDKLRDAPSGVISPVTKKPIPPASPSDLLPLRNKSRDQARERAEKVVDKQIAKARQAQSEAAVRRGHRLIASLAMIGRHADAVPSHATHIASELADLHADGRALDYKLARALNEHTSATKAAADLAQVQKGKLPKGMQPEDAADLRARAQEITDTRDRAAQDVEGLRAQIAAHEFRTNQKAAEFAHAMHNGPAKVEATRRSRSMAIQAIRRDLMRASAGARAPYEAFIASPTVQRLKGLYEAGKAHAVGMTDTAYNGFVDLARHALFKKVTVEGEPGEPAKTGWAIDPAKALLHGGVLAAASEGGRDLYGYAHDHARAALSGEKSKTKFPKSIKIERQIDAINGGVYVGISAPDPDNRDDRILLWGQRFKKGEEPERLQPGARVSAIREKLGGGGKNGGGRAPFVPDSRDVANLPADTKKKIDDALGALKDKLHVLPIEEGHAIKFRSSGDETKENEASAFVGHVRNSFLASGSPTNAQRYHDALDTILGSNQGRILKQKQAYQLLTGFTTGGQKKGNGGVFKAGEDSGFADQNKADVLEALKGEVDRAMESYAPQNDRQRTNLVRAVATVGKAKGIGDDDLKPLYNQIRGTGAETTSTFSDTLHVKPTVTQAEPAPAQRKRRLDANTTATQELPAGWDQKKLREASHDLAVSIAPKLGINKEEKIADTATMIEMLGRIAHASHKLPMQDALKAAHDTIAHVSAGGGPNKSMTRDAIANVDADAFLNTLSDHADRAELIHLKRTQAQKLCFLDDLDALMKAVVDDESGPIASRVGRELLEEGIDRAGRGAGAAAAPHDASNYTPTKIARDLGGLAAGETAGYFAAEGASKLIGKLFPEVGGAVGVVQALREAYAGGGARAGANAAIAAAKRTAITHGGKIIAGSAAALPAYFAGSAAAGAAARGAYRAVGKAPPPDVAPDLTPGEKAGESIGNVVGAGIGGVLGEGVASIATGAAGGYIGSIVGRNAADIGSSLARYFSGYDPAKSHAILQRMNAMGGGRAQPAQQPASKAPARSAGGTGRGGDPYHDRTGRFSSQGDAA